LSEERFRELWAQVEHIGKIEHLSDDAMLALGSVFGELKSKINEQAERVQELENENRILRTVAESNKYIGEQYLEQNKRYREAIAEIENAWKFTKNYQEHIDVIQEIINELEGEFNEQRTIKIN